MKPSRRWGTRIGGLKGAEELFEEVGGYGGSVFGGGADVVDGEGFGGEGGSGLGVRGAMVAGVMGWLRRTASVAGRRVGRSRVAAPMRMSSMVPLFMWARAAMATLEMACALRVPTLRV